MLIAGFIDGDSLNLESEFCLSTCACVICAEPRGPQQGLLWLALGCVGGVSVGAVAAPASVCLAWRGLSDQPQGLDGE